MVEEKKVDPLTVSIVSERLLSISRELGIRIMRAAQSPVTTHIRDLGTVIFDGMGRIIAQAEWMPVHTAGAHIAFKGIFEKFAGEIYPDDFIIGNDPYSIRFGHLPDWSFLRPVFYEDELVSYTYVRTHQYDTGGAYPGGYMPRCFDVHSEGLILPPLKLFNRGEQNKELFDLILKNVRGARMVRMDCMLILSAMKMAEERLIALYKEYSKETLKEAIDNIINSTEKAMRKEISRIPSGIYKSTSAADSDGTRPDPVWVRLTMTVDANKGELTFDYSKSDKQVDFVNTPLGQTYAATYTGMLWSVNPRILRNHGIYIPVTIIAPEGTVVNPKYPATVGSCACSVTHEIIECIQLALTQAIPEDVPASWTRHLSPVLFGFDPRKLDPRTGVRRYYWSSPFTSDGSSGAIWGYDGWEALGPSHVAGGVLRAPVELEEREIPYRYLRYEFLKDSAGDGKFRGGLGVHVEYLNEHPEEGFIPNDAWTMTGNSDGEKFAPFGLLGGRASIPNRMWILRKGELLPLHTFDIVPLQPGDVVITKSGGGGGVGDPLDRDIEKVRLDVLNEYISVERAREVYGVVVNAENFEVDIEATRKLRRAQKRQ